MDFLLTIPGSLGVFPPSPAIRVTWNSRESQIPKLQEYFQSLSFLQCSRGRLAKGWNSWQLENPSFPSEFQTGAGAEPGMGLGAHFEPSTGKFQRFFFSFPS